MIEAAALQQQIILSLNDYATTPQSQAYLDSVYRYIGLGPSAEGQSAGASGDTGGQISPEEISTGARFGSALGLLDHPLDYAGQLSGQINGNVQTFLQNDPAAGTAAQLVGVGLAIAGGPEALVTGLALNAAQGQVSQAVTDRFRSVGFGQGVADSAGQGASFISTSVFAGFGALKLGAGLFGSITGAIKNLGKAAESEAVPQIVLNKAAGDAYEAEVLSNVLPQTQTNIQPEITVLTNGPSGLKVRLDALGEDLTTGDIVLTDAKASQTAPLTPNQTIVYPELQTYGGTVVGQGKAPYVGGTPIPPTQVQIIRKP
jgi:hypothetical protein